MRNSNIPKHKLIKSKIGNKFNHLGNKYVNQQNQHVGLP